MGDEESGYGGYFFAGNSGFNPTFVELRVFEKSLSWI